jgi:glycosyltransferase involved in cell wall biosynthesis
LVIETHVSVVMPAFNEAGALPDALERLDAFLGAAGPRQIIVVDDGSTDSTAETVESLQRPDVEVLRMPRNCGKGAAVRAGVLHSRGRIVVITDADGEYLHNDGAPYLQAVDSGEAVVLASRTHPDSHWPHSTDEAAYVRRRRLMSRVFRHVVRAVVGLRVGDSQTGLKLLPGDAARRLFARQRILGFAYDVEILCRARKQGLRVVELPLEYRGSAAGSKVRFWHPLLMFADLWRIRRHLRA